ncbi:MAG: murein L,D-transpeptidase catalytic domain family protein [Metallibacterium sp.]
MARLVAALVLPASAASAAGSSLWRSLAQAAPTANPQVLRLAVAAMHCAVSSGMPGAQRLAVIDYSLPSTRRRLWIFNLADPRLLMRELVAHGRNSGNNFAKHFSDRLGSLESSLGLYRTLGTYQGDNGYSLRLQGLDEGFNNNALQRAIVIHGAPYVSEAFAQREGRLGRSWGCPAVSKRVAPRVINALKGGQFVFAYYPNQRWLSDSDLLHCAAARRSVAAIEADPGQAAARTGAAL